MSQILVDYPVGERKISFPRLSGRQVKTLKGFRVFCSYDSCVAEQPKDIPEGFVTDLTRVYESFRCTCNGSIVGCRLGPD